MTRAISHPLPSEEHWAVEASFANRLASVTGKDLSAAAARVPLNYEAALPLTKAGSVAVVDVDGLLEKRTSLFAALFGGTSYDAIRAALAKAVADEQVATIILRIDSPGGACVGVADACDAVRAAAQRKRVVAVVDGLCASAAYAIASQASEVYAGRMDLVGSVGVYTLLFDQSEAFAKEGIRAICITTAELKGAGAPGTPITPAQVAEFKRRNDAWFSDFKATVARGRRMSAQQVETIADGRVWHAPDAQRLGLIDGIKTFAEVVREVTQTKPRVTKGTSSMLSTTPETLAALATETPGTPVILPTVADLKAACPGADAAFLLGQLEAGATCEAAAAAWGDASAAPTEAKLRAVFPRNRGMETDKSYERSIKEMLGCATMADARKMWVKGEEALAFARANRPGGPIVEDRVVGDNQRRRSASALKQFQAAVAKQVKQGVPADRATMAVIRDNAALHRQMLLEVNSNNPVGLEMLRDRFQQEQTTAKPAAEAFRAACRELQAEGHSRAAAVKLVREEQPDLWAEMLMEANRGRGVEHDLGLTLDRQAG